MVEKITFGNNSNAIFYNESNGEVYLKSKTKKIPLSNEESSMEKKHYITLLYQSIISPTIKPNIYSIAFESFVNHNNCLKISNTQISNTNHQSTNIHCLKIGIYLFKINLCIDYSNKDNHKDSNTMIFATKDNINIDHSMFTLNMKSESQTLEFIHHNIEPSIINFYLFNDSKKNILNTLENNTFDNCIINKSQASFLRIEYFDSNHK